MEIPSALFVCLGVLMMICPHCSKEVEGYIAFKPVTPLNLNLAAGAAPVIPSVVFNSGNSVCAAQPVTFPQTLHLNLNANGCAGGQAPILHYFACSE